MRFGAGIATCREGLAYPPNFLDLDGNVELTQLAERLGYHAVWANDHLVTQQSVAKTIAEPPNFYEPLITFAYIAAQTSKIRMLVATIVAPLRDPVLLAKQVVTLDHVSGGRFTLGLGIGSYREEFEAIKQPAPKTNRGKMMEEQAEALRALFENTHAEYDGKYFSFKPIQINPKPQQQPFPLYMSGNTPKGIKRVARLAQGWIAGGSPSPERLRDSVELLRKAAQEVGRDPDEIEVTAQLRIAIGDTSDEAMTVLKDSQHFKRICASKPDESPDDLAKVFASRDLMGSPEELIQRVGEYEAAGADQLGLIFLADNRRELFERVELFGKKVLPAFQA